MNGYSSYRGRESGGPHAYPVQPRWRALEVAVVVVGFILWWPLGLALLLWKLWRNRQGYTQDMVSAARGLVEENVMKRWPEVSRSWGANRVQATARDWGFPTFRSSGNTAFDAWREGELARLEEERRKLETAEREFADYIESLRRAKDEEEFQRFMRDRSGPSQPRSGL